MTKGWASSVSTARAAADNGRGGISHLRCVAGVQRPASPWGPVTTNNANLDGWWARCVKWWSLGSGVFPPFPTPSENPPSPQLHIPFSFALSTHGGFNPPPPHHSLVRVHKPAMRRLDQLTTESKSPYRLRRSHVGSLRPQRAEAHNQTPITAPAATPVNRMREVGAIPSAWRAAKHM